jgi:Xaa-Pro aminopeptidase
MAAGGGVGLLGRHDLTRTFVRGEISEAIAELHALVLTAHERSCAAVKPGIPGVELYGIACDLFESLTGAFPYDLVP